MVSELQDPRLREVSGIAASRQHSGWFYVHNDSGDGSNVYVIDRAGALVGVIELESVQAVDFEDIAIAPGADGFDVCVGDIGDNSGRREFVGIVRFSEREALLGVRSDARRSRVRPTVHRVRYPDSAGDAEGLAVDPVTGDAYIFKKDVWGRCDVYRLAAPWPQQAKLERVATLRVPVTLPGARVVTAADFRPDGSRLLTRSYLCGWEWRLEDGVFTSDAAQVAVRRDEIAKRLADDGVRVAMPLERQGEAAAHAADGSGILTISEGWPAFLSEVPCQAP